MQAANRKPLTLIDLNKMKQENIKISCLTAYDASFSALLDHVGIDILLVGDSLGMTIQGHSSTLPVSLVDMIYHTRCVNRTRKRSFLIADLPFMTYPTPLVAAKNAMQLIQQGAQMVKLEGLKLDIIRFIIDQGIPVCGHLGLLPQSINQLGSYAVQGKTAADAEALLTAALALEAEGVSLLVLECVPAQLAKTITAQLNIPVIGIGAGIDCDGQVLVLYDLLNISIKKTPKFSHNFLQETHSIEQAVANYHNAVKNREFPTPEHSFYN
ncbi:MAG: 3-methyl-2-oxobutanoate hydroxymethyltransferase [Methylovulum sp.]|jgi:3-methyl-2-oxobutanoate hydroxymethyltransferase|nr:3-methyl-2-oxobutanoate hydroxymethyltransferase [Methylovulum sp.]